MYKKRFCSYSISSVEEPSINLTPLIDVVFVILIMFIVIAPLLQMEKIELARSNASNHSAKVKSNPITIYVDAHDQISLNGNVIHKEELLEELKKAKSQFPLYQPQLLHDKEARFGTYQFVKNNVENAGFQELEVILKPN